MAWCENLVICLPYHAMLSYAFKCFLLNIVDQVTPPHPLILSLTHYIRGEMLDPLGIHLFWCAHGGERTTSHDVVQDVFTSIVRNARFHVLQE
jgi:hypothetical protein